MLMLLATMSVPTDELASLVAREPTLWERWGTPPIIGLTAALAGAMLLTLIIALRRRTDALSYGPEDRNFCRAIGLTARERRTMNRLANQAGLPGAVTLLASRGAFEHAIRLAVDSLSATQKRQIASVRARLQALDTERVN